MFVVCFTRNDGNPVENYYYHKKEDAVYHFMLFKNDDSGFYNTISVFDEETPISNFHHSASFPKKGAVKKQLTKKDRSL